jgi:predicted DNA-binding transcriptional regulator YafY
VSVPSCGWRSASRAACGLRQRQRDAPAPLAKDQKLASHDNTRHVLEVTVPDTMELRGWIAMYGPGIEILPPASLRKEFVANAAALARTYEHG